MNIVHALSHFLCIVSRWATSCTEFVTLWARSAPCGVTKNRTYLHIAIGRYHWHFQQSYEALMSKLYLPGMSGMVNGIEASLRTTIRLIDEGLEDGDLGRTMSNRLLRDCQGLGLKVEKLAFPTENDFLERLKENQTHVKIVSLRHNICHGNFEPFFEEDAEMGGYFTPELLRTVSAELLDISFDWALEIRRFMQERGFAFSDDEYLEKPKNPLVV